MDYQTAIKGREAAPSYYPFIRNGLQISEERYLVRTTIYVEVGLLRANTFGAAYQIGYVNHRQPQLLAGHYYDGDGDLRISKFY